MAKKKLSQNDLDKTLRDLGFKEGDELLLPSDETESNETNEGEEDTGGSNPPGNKPKPDKP